VTPLSALLIIEFLLENNMWNLGCYKWEVKTRSSKISGGGESKLL